MEAQIADIEDRTTLTSLKQLRTSIIDCAKNIKSNDTTFRISTLPTVTDKMTSLMSRYIDTVQRVEAYQSAFLELNEKLDNEQGDSDTWTGQYSDLERLSNMIQQTIDRKFQEVTTDETEAHLELDRIIGPPVDAEVEDIETLAPAIPKDPITRKDIKVAVRSTVCNHIYDQEAIESYFQQKEMAKRTRIQCPQIGCTNKTMSRSELVLDEETNKLIQSL